MLVLRHSARLLRDLLAYAGRSGRWWMPVLIVTLAVAAVVVTTAKIAVPTIIYTLF